jgi:hypothetical protein
MNVAKHIRYEIQEVIGLYCITLEDGQKIYDAMISELRSGHSIELDFRGVRIVAPPFLNAAIGQLMREFTREQIDKQIRFLNLSDLFRVTLQLVLKGAEQYFGDPAVQAAVDAIIQKRAVAGNVD